MLRYKRVLKELNMYEKSIFHHKEEEVKLERLKRDEILFSLSRSKKYGHVYNLCKENNIKIIHHLLPYLVFTNKEKMYVYKMKTKEEFEKGYKEAFLKILELKEQGLIDINTYRKLKRNFHLMHNNFAQEFEHNALDSLSTKELVDYDLIIMDIMKKYNKYVSTIGNEVFYDIGQRYKKSSKSVKERVLKKQGQELKKIFESQDECLVKDINYPLDVLCLEQCFELKANEVYNEKIKKALLEEIEFIKSGFQKIRSVNNIVKIKT